MKTITITTTYMDDTRELQTTVILGGFVTGLPDKMLTASQFDTVTLAGTDKLLASDSAILMQSIARALLTANNQAVGYVAVNDNKDKAGEVIATDLDPVGTFDAALVPPT